MDFNFCPKCGEKLSLKEIGDEGMVPFCGKCARPWFAFSYPCVIVIAINEDNQVALIKQSYGNTDRYVCVAGYMKSGESAESTVIREVKEEIGLVVISTKYVKSYAYQKKDNLMLGFVAKVKKSDFTISNEVSVAKWFSLEEAIEALQDSTIAIALLKEYIQNFHF